jgi:hypothetical protein
MKVCGVREKLMDMANLSTLIEKFMRVNGWTIRLTESGPILMLMELNTTESGKMTSSMAMERNPGQMVACMRESIR